MAGAAVDPPDAHEHTEQCRRLYAEWLRYDAAVSGDPGLFTAGQVQEAFRERELFERQLHAVGCSSEAIRRDEGDRDVAQIGRPLL